MEIIKAPARIDLAGGTLDIWPLSVIFAPSYCINVAINLYATVRAERNKNIEGLVIHEKRLRKTIRLPRRVSEAGETLYDRAFRQIPVSGWEFTVECESPAGAGLGGSSALLIALLKMLCRLSRKKMPDYKILRIAQDIEARHLGIPTGVQDYVAALGGGMNIVQNGVGGLTFSRLRLKAAEIEKRVVLAYSGKSRVSGKTNWQQFKRAIEVDKTARRVFSGIAENSLRVMEALESGRFSETGTFLFHENSLREKLGRSIIPARLRYVFEILRKAGGYPKICGAGGGGCFMVWCEPETRKNIISILLRHNMEPLNFRPAPRTPVNLPRIRIKPETGSNW
ncbi:MAG: dehydrogenase [bacterium]|nr:MAG: dehydrogenase [bacterium]